MSRARCNIYTRGFSRTVTPLDKQQSLSRGNRRRSWRRTGMAAGRAESGQLALLGERRHGRGTRAWRPLPRKNRAGAAEAIQEFARLRFWALERWAVR